MIYKIATVVIHSLILKKAKNIIRFPRNFQQELSRMLKVKFPIWFLFLFYVRKQKICFFTQNLFLFF